VLRRLLALNHDRAKAEAMAPQDGKASAKQRKRNSDSGPGLFAAE